MRCEVRFIVGFESNCHLFAEVEVLATTQDEEVLRVLTYFFDLAGHLAGYTQYNNEELIASCLLRTYKSG
jgi:hypothetical protein